MVSTRAFTVRHFACQLLIAAWLAVPAAAGPFSSLIVFGDSLSDVGNIDAVTPSFFKFPGPYYYQGRFSNGPVWVEALAPGLGLPTITRSTAGGNDFAYGGAQTSGTGGLEGLFIRDVDEQVTQFLSTRTVDPAALFLVFAGSNDLIGGQTNVNVPVNRLATDLGRLITAGARQFLVPNLPPLGYTPRFNGNPTTLSQYNTRSFDFNAALAAVLDNLEAGNPALEFHRLDVAGLFGEALVNPGAFGLANVTDAAAPGLQPGDNSYDTEMIADEPNTYLFWDDLHPTATVHAALAQRALSLLLPLAGDYNGNHVVEAADYTVWRNSLGQTGMGLAADGNGDNIIDRLDYDVWKSHYGETSGTTANWVASPAVATARSDVPEPASAVLVLIGGAFIQFYVRFTPRRTRRPVGLRCPSCA
jgi:phospholipase/lecithinase/hemolysin